uniref:Tumor suppressor ARF n=4 Tax=Rattus norvegicus TaxID=10116 RepID=ARF_RAT|nr:RecName: Full=Tumor suppressor ARF; AltName: Full=Alternative reading frame; Short=ARF; AltName: Full=Cyclin-dependent kinase inhibitor 2A; AltName: Full=p19ARF [Rattus norvegicus]AAL76336.1 cyclin-dependent kinase inhibitor 2a p19Arf [Rattus norvegicus]AAL76337.1 cyclin-dependent kinase inhibitor 2a p19Arf [Rattus norvegicus]AAT92509.1 cyclin-dependent kinase inhibitor 2a p19Arf [Rattus norvegicus]
MGRRFVVTVRIRRTGRSPQVRVFLVQFLGSSRPRSANGTRGFVALVLRPERIARRGPQPHPGPGDDDGQRQSGSSPALLWCRFELRGPHHPLPTGARRSAGGLPRHSGSTAPGRGAAGCARCLGSPAARPGPRAGTSRRRAVFAVSTLLRWERFPGHRQA